MCGSHISVSGAACAAKLSRPSEKGERENVSGRRALGHAMGKDGDVVKDCMSSGRVAGGVRIGVARGCGTFDLTEAPQATSSVLAGCFASAADSTMRM